MSLSLYQIHLAGNIDVSDIIDTHTTAVLYGPISIMYIFLFSRRRLVYIISDTNTRIPFPLCCCCCLLSAPAWIQHPESPDNRVRDRHGNGWRFFFYFYLIFDAPPHLLFSCLFCVVSACVRERVTQFPHGKASPRDPTVGILISSLRNDNNQTEKQPPCFLIFF